jgi:hypothetical protein
VWGVSWKLLLEAFGEREDVRSDLCGHFAFQSGTYHLRLERPNRKEPSECAVVNRGICGKPWNR